MTEKDAWDGNGTVNETGNAAVNAAVNGRHIKWYLSFLIGAAMGAIVFLLLYGPGVLNVTYEDWLLKGWYDLSQHYVGWKLYRASGWHFPIGLCDNSFYPYLASVIYTDSIPLFSFIFKILSPILPETFQFFGLYGLFCFMMQGGISKLLLRKVLVSEDQCILATIPFLFCAPLWQRMYYHTALASHYLILLGIMLFMYREDIRKRRHRIILWCGLGVLCVLTHITIYAMVSVMLLCFALLEMLDATDATMAGASKESGGVSYLRAVIGSLPTFLSYLVFYLASTTAVFALFGGFYGNITGESDGLGAYSANLNSLFNPIDYSRIIKEFPLIDCQYEGLSYIGIMAVIMLIPSAAYVFIQRKSLFAKHKNYIIAILMGEVILWVIALSPKVTFNSHVLFEIPLPGVIYDAWSIFRASGRFLWPVMYATILMSLYFARCYTKKIFAYLLILGCVLQVFEFSEKIESISSGYRDKITAYYEVYDLWDETGTDDIEHVQFMHPYTFGEFYGDEVRDQMIGYTMFALRNGMTVSNFHFSRDDMEKLADQIHESEKKLKSGNPDRDTMYVFKKEDVTEDILDTYHNVKRIYTSGEVILIADDPPTLY